MVQANENEQYIDEVRGHFLNKVTMLEFPVLSVVETVDNVGVRTMNIADAALVRIESRQQAIYDKAEIYTQAAVKAAWARDLPEIELVPLNRKYRGLPRSEWDRILDIPFSIMVPQRDLIGGYQYAYGFQGHVSNNFGISGVATVCDRSTYYSYCAVLVADSTTECHWEVIEPVEREFLVIGQGICKARKGQAVL